MYNNKKITDMTAMKKIYVKPAIQVIEVEPQQMICMSGEETLMYRRRKDDGNDIEPYSGGFD